MLKLLTRRPRSHFSTTSTYSWQPGDTQLGFKLISSTYHPDFSCHLHHLTHQSSQSQLYHIQKADPNCCFAPIVRTLARNDKGSPHILQHLACCGSERFPVRDPFFNMLKRSLNTYMNAWTGTDFTCYPFSTANRKDFGNLMRVYTDMVFNPKLDYLDFRQEGWRYELDQGKVVYKGIVLNEMLGAYQSPDRKASKELMNNLLADTPYQFDTGGYPPDIVKLDYEELVRMHREFYSPSNVKFFSYGNHDIRQELLPFLEQNYLSKAPSQRPLDLKEHNFIPTLKNRQSTIYTSSPQNQIMLSFYLGQLNEIPRSTLWSLQVLNYLLFETPQAVFYQQLIEMKIGTTFTAQQGTSFDKLLTFSVGVKGNKNELTHQEFKGRVIEALEKIKKEGFDSERIEQAVHQLMILNAMPTSNEGLRFLERLMTPINHGCDVKEQLSYKTELTKVGELMKDKAYVGELIDKFLIHNKHHSSVLQLSKNGQEDEFELQPPASTDNSNQKVEQEQKDLASRQNSKGDNSVLPTLSLQDIQKKMEGYSLSIKILKEGPKVSFVQTSPTGITHFRAVFRFPYGQIPQNTARALELWAYTLMKGISTNKRDYKQLSKELSLYSTGFNVSFDYHPKTFSTLIIFRIAALDHNIPKALQLLTELFSEPKFDNLEDTFNAFKSDALNDMVQNPMGYARSAAASGVHPVEKLKDKFWLNYGGLEIVKQFEEGDQEAVIQDLKKIHERLLNCDNVGLVFHGSDFKCTGSVKPLLSILSPKQSPISVPSFTQEMTYKFFPNAVHNVDCCASAFLGPAPFSQECAHISVFLQLLQQNFLHKEIRQKGGAYGSSARYLNSGVVCLGSYLDPSSLRTIRVFKESVGKLLEKDITEEEVKEAKLSLFSRLDTPVVEHDKGIREVVYGQTYAVVSQFRHQCLKATVEQIKQAGRKYLQDKPCSTATVGPMDKQKEELAKRETQKQ